MTECRQCAADQVERDEFEFPQHVFDIIAEYPQVEHVARQVHESGM